MGETISLDDYVNFQYTEGSPADLESLVMLERALAKGEIRMGQSKVLSYATGFAVVGIALVIVLYLAKEFGILPL